MIKYFFPECNALEAHVMIMPVHEKHTFCILFQRQERGAVAQSVERATPGEEVPSSIPAVAARSLLVGLVSV